jgi:fluoroquinolone transport system ATP-binding protein
MITVKNLQYTYPQQEKQALQNINFDIEKGEIFGFLGPSGSGKSTTQKILFKLLSGYSGEVSIMGKDLQAWGRDFYHHIGVGFELPNHYLKLSALENLQFFAAFYNKSYATPMDLLAMVGLEKDAHKPVGDFSKGMKMRLNFVRAFMHAPDILFFDEPTSGLDPSNAHIIKNIIKTLRSEGKTIFITTHQMYDADELCDVVAFLVDGKIMAMDTPQALKIQYAKNSVAITQKDQADTKKIFFDLHNLHENQIFMQALRDNNIATIHSQEATLDDVFITVTGRNLAS